MSDILKKWMVDAEAYDMQKLYCIDNESEYDFINNQSDFYITLLTRMYSIIDSVKNFRYDEKAKELIDIAQAMLLYSDNFDGVDKVSNRLYVATIYFLVRYEAIASFLLKNCDINKYKTESAQLIYYILSGGECDIHEIKNLEVCKKVEKLKTFILSGGGGLESLQNEIIKKFEKFKFFDVDDFFDTALLKHVINKFSANNIRIALSASDTDTNWNNYIKFSFNNHIMSFLPSQEDAINKGLLKYKRAFSLKMPTSAGKSYITELVIYQELEKNKNAKILYLTPLRALSRELELRFRDVGKALNFKTRAIYGGNVFSLNQEAIEDVQLLIATPESFQGMEESIDEQLSKFSLVVCDEGQLLDSLHRGIDYELLLTRLKRIENVRFLFISAIIPNIESINTWLGGKKTEVGNSDYRPCPIRLAYYNNEYDIFLKGEDYLEDKYTLNDFIKEEELNKIGKTKRAKACAIALKSLSSGSVLLFTSQKGGNMGCEAIGNDFLKILENGDFRPPKDFSSDESELKLIALYISYQYGDNHPLVTFVKSGFAYHHGSLPQDVREVIEQSYYNKILPLLISTTTLAEGVNLPIQTLILYNLYRYDYRIDKPVVLETTEIKNIVGRAGRAGKQRFGFVIYPDNKLYQVAYKNVVSALRNTDIPNFMGALYRVIKVFDKNKDRYSDEIMNNIMESLGYAQAIDTMITRSVKTESLENVDIENVIMESLAYYVGDNDIRDTLSRVFKIRHEALSEKLNDTNFHIYCDTRMSINDFITVEKLITQERLSTIDITQPLSESWIDFAIKVILEMPSSYEEYSEKREIKNILNYDNLKILLVDWVNGKQYYEIARDLECEVDNVVDLINYVQIDFCVSLSSMIRYVNQKMNTDTLALEEGCEMIKYGINSHEKLMLFKSGLTDRIVINSIFNDDLLRILSFDSNHALYRSMAFHREDVLAIATHMGLPIICIRKLNNYLRNHADS